MPSKLLRILQSIDLKSIDDLFLLLGIRLGKFGLALTWGGVLAVALLNVTGCKRDVVLEEPFNSVALDGIEPAAVGDVMAFCGACHVPPSPATYPKDHWAIEVRRGFQFYQDYDHKDKLPFPPNELQVVKYYVENAPEHLAISKPDQVESKPRVRFRREVVEPSSSKAKPAVAHLLAGRDGLLVSDMISGEIEELHFGDAMIDRKLVAKVKAATHALRVDLFGVGRKGVLVGDIGNPTPEDHDLGGVYFFQDPPQVSNVEPVELLTSIGRVADVSTADFNGDGMLDIVVAEFGYLESGSLHLLLRNDDHDSPGFNHQVIDERHGTSHVFCRDIDEDGDVDLICLRSQEYENVEVFLNDGSGDFQMEAVYSGPVPDYGCSCIDVGDIDGDGDLDIALSNGDSMDSFLLKAHHGVQWLENVSEESEGIRFQHHRIADLVGAYGVSLGDIDGDGDVDLAACSMTWDGAEINTLAWFEQVDEKQFVKHTLELSIDQHACLEVADLDGDGDLDLAVGEFDQFVELGTWVTIWWNEGASGADVSDQVAGLATE
ncbi:MAG: FG-GAP repeat domain-containing protein [Aureliella sp.]